MLIKLSIYLKRTPEPKSGNPNPKKDGFLCRYGTSSDSSVSENFSSLTPCTTAHARHHHATHSSNDRSQYHTSILDYLDVTDEI